MFRSLCLSLFVGIMLFVSMPAFTSEMRKENFDDFGALPIMHEGRVKPIDSFARAMKKSFSGSAHDSLPWLIETLFNPAGAENIQILKFSNPDILNMLGLERHKNKLYSYKEISEALDTKQDILVSILKTPDEEWTPSQRDFVLLQQKTAQLGELLASMSLFLPLSVHLPADSPTSLKEYTETPLTYLDVSKFREALQKEVASILKDKQQNIESYSDAQQAIAVLSFTFANLHGAGERSTIFRVIPAKERNAWVSPWQTILGHGGPDTKQLFENWASLAAAYHQNDPQIWQSQIQDIHRLTLDKGAQNIRPIALVIENLYNQLQPLTLSAWLYALSFLTLITGLIVKRKSSSHGASILGLAVFVHALAIGTRMFILERPPVSTLYESIIFVGLVAALYGLALFLKNKENFWLFLGSGCGLFLALVSFTHNQDGDSFLMLTAVLNTNFWLATHVICITAGYAFCLVASVLGHATLLNPQQNLIKHMHSVALVALLFSAVGTVLGGIWADQSWGRFWGWDPKENGALLIVLWLIWFLHGRISGDMKQMFVSAGLAYLSVIVALSWFGVNLLSVGLHAYGFTDSAALGLSIFVAIETMLISGLVYYRKQSKYAL